MSFASRALLGAIFVIGACAAAAPAAAKPIAFQSGATAMAEYGGDTMSEVQGYYAPRYWWSAGAGLLRLAEEHGTFSRDVRYVRINVLAHRWNLPAAQANVFTWGGAGTAQGSDFAGARGAVNAGGQFDFETRRVYASARADWHRASTFAHRIDTLQLGVAPVLHDYDRIAWWLVAQGRTYTGGLYDGVEPALLVRAFRAWSWGSAWLEAGATADGKLQSMIMLNF